MAKPKIEVGQTLYVNVTELYATNKEPNLTEYKVSKVNTSSVYIQKNESAREVRLDRSGLVSSQNSFFRYRAYISPDGYWIPIQRRNEKAELLKELSDFLSKKDNEQLQEIKNYIMEA